MALFQAAIIGLIALIVAPGLFFYFDVTPKIAILLLGTAVALLWPRRNRPFAGPRSFAWLSAASLMSLAISTELSSNRALSLFGTNWRRYGLITQAVVLIFTWLVAQNVAGKPERARAILRGVALSGALTAIFGIAQYFGWDPVLPKAAYHVGEGIWTIVRPPGTLGYASYFATWLLAVVFLSLALAGWETSARVRTACYAASALAAVAIVLTGTRAAMLALAAGMVVWLFGRGFRIPRRALAVAAVLLVAAVAFYYSPPGWQLRSRSRWFAEDPWGGARVRLWQDSLSMGLRRPLGYGPEVFTASFPRFESPSLARAYPDFLHESPHNIFLDALVSQGIPGLLILVGFCWIGFTAAWRRKQVWLAAALAAAVASQMFTVFTMPTALIFYVTIAIAVAVGTDPIPEGSRMGAIFSIPVAILLVFAAIRPHCRRPRLSPLQGRSGKWRHGRGSLAFSGLRSPAPSRFRQRPLVFAGIRRVGRDSSESVHTSAGHGAGERRRRARHRDIGRAVQRLVQPVVLLCRAERFRQYRKVPAPGHSCPAELV